MLMEYTPTLVGLILDVSNTESMAMAKQALVEFIKHFNNEDRIYFYSPTSTDIPRRRGVTLGQIMNHNHFTVRLGLAVKQCVWLMNAEEEEEYRKIIFVITDGVNPLHNYEIRKSIFYDREGEFEFVFLCLDEEAFERLDFSLYREHTVVNLTRRIVAPADLYKAMVTTNNPDFEFPPEPELETVKNRVVKEEETEKPEVKIQVAKICLDDLDESDERPRPQPESDESDDEINLDDLDLILGVSESSENSKLNLDDLDLEDEDGENPPG